MGLVKWKLKPPAVENEPIFLTCFCGSFLNEICFTRVLELPSGGWDASHAFCHARDEKTIEKFRKSDCLFGTHFIHISDESLSQWSCPECSVAFGLMQNGFVKVWLANVTLNSVCDLRGQFLAIVFDVVMDPMEILPKILLRSGGVLLAMRVLEKNLKVFRWDLNLSGSLKGESVMKVEYFFGQSGRSEWETDSRAHDIDVPMRLLDYARGFLDDSHKALHPSFCKTAEFNLAYIPVSLE